MVSVSLRQEVDWEPARNAIDGLERGVPPRAIPGYRARPGAPAPLAPWDQWPMPPKRPDLFAAKIRRHRKPSPAPTADATEPDADLRGPGPTGPSRPGGSPSTSRSRSTAPLATRLRRGSPTPAASSH